MWDMFLANFNPTEWPPCRPQYSLRAPGHLDDPIVMVELDTSNGVMFPMYDPDANLIYLCGKVSPRSPRSGIQI